MPVRLRPPWSRSPSITRSVRTLRKFTWATRAQRTANSRSTSTGVRPPPSPPWRCMMPPPMMASLNCLQSSCLGDPGSTTFVCDLPVRASILSGRSIGWRSPSDHRMPLVTILAPFDGWCTGLEEVPDPVFSGRMLGDGVAIDPVSGILLAPCAGKVVTLPASAHAVTIRTPGGAGGLGHLGIDTVQLGGGGFEGQVELGQVVEAGEELIRFDLDTVARGAKTLLTPV